MTIRRRIVKIEEDGGEPSRYGNPPSWTVHYRCGHTVSRTHTSDLSMKAMFLRKDPDTYLIGVCQECAD